MVAMFVLSFSLMKISARFLQVILLQDRELVYHYVAFFLDKKPPNLFFLQNFKQHVGFYEVYLRIFKNVQTMSG